MKIIEASYEILDRRKMNAAQKIEMAIGNIDLYIYYVEYVL